MSLLNVSNRHAFLVCVLVSIFIAACGPSWGAETGSEPDLSGTDASPELGPASADPTTTAHGSIEDLMSINVFDDMPDYTALNVIESWRFESDVEIASIAPEVIEYLGVTRLYIPGPPRGIVSYTTEDGTNWTEESGVRIACDRPTLYGHPYGAIAPDGQLRLFVQTQIVDEDGNSAPFFVSTAVSDDGVAFSQPEPAFSCQDFGAESCAHGRILQLPDQSYLLAVSASIQVQNWPRDVFRAHIPGTLLAFSDDLANWDFTDVFFRACHDPTFDTSQGRVSLYCMSETVGTLIRFDSTDGTDWEPLSPVGLVEYLDSNDGVVNETYVTGDIDIHTFADGTTRTFVSVNDGPAQAVWTFLLEE